VKANLELNIITTFEILAACCTWGHLWSYNTFLVISFFTFFSWTKLGHLSTKKIANQNLVGIVQGTLKIPYLLN
jgi:hypothetical protein